MNNHLQNNYGLNLKQAKEMKVAILWNFIQNLMTFFPNMLAFAFIIMALGERPESMPLYMIWVAAGILVLMYFATYRTNNLTYFTIYSQASDNRVDIAERLRKLPLSYFGEKDLADLSNTIMTDINTMEEIFSHALPQMYASIFSVSFIAIMMFIYDYRLAAMLFWVVPVAFVVFRLSKSFRQRVSQEGFDRKRQVSDRLQEGLELAGEIKAYNMEDEYSGLLSNLINEHERQLIKGDLIGSVMLNFSHAILKLGISTVIVGGALLYFNGSLDIIKYIIFLVISASVFEPIYMVLENIMALSTLKPRVERIREIQEIPLQQGTTVFEPSNYDIEFSDVNFSYDDNAHSNGKKTIEGASFIAKQGQVTALVGPSGGGKSTLAKLAARFWDIDSGKLSVGGIDISSVDPETLLKDYSIVFQNVTLFNTSVMENIRIGKSDASDEEVIRAARLAEADDFIDKLPDKYDQIIGENGEKLSGGERQRISIARAILKDAPIILLDEATASLDVYNESKIQKALSKLVRNKTVIVIAHRMRTILSADKVVVIKDGKILQIGTPEELLKIPGEFQKMNER